MSQSVVRSVKNLRVVAVQATLLLLLLGSGAPALAQSADEPPEIMGQGMVYDSAGKQVILFGGSHYSNGYTMYRDTWSLDVQRGAWNKATTKGPTGRFNMGMAYDGDQSKIVLFGGMGPTGRQGDTWVYDIASKTWVNAYPSTAPHGRSDPGMTYDAGAKRVILFGGYVDAHLGEPDSASNETWAYDMASNSWSRMNPETSPGARYGCAMVYDSYTKKTLLFGGHFFTSSPAYKDLGYDDEVWAYSYLEDSWEKLVTDTKPPERYWHALSYDTDLNRVVLFGGNQGGGNDLGDTWVFDCRTNKWSQVASTNNPEPRSLVSMTYDSNVKRTVLFGGADFTTGSAFSYFNSVWMLDQSGQWRRMTIGAETKPPAPESTGIAGYPPVAVLIGIGCALLLIKFTRFRYT